MTNSEAILTVRGLTKSLGDGNTELVCFSPPFFGLFSPRIIRGFSQCTLPDTSQIPCGSRLR